MIQINIKKDDFLSSLKRESRRMFDITRTQINVEDITDISLSVPFTLDNNQEYVRVQAFYADKSIPHSFSSITKMEVLPIFN